MYDLHLCLYSLLTQDLKPDKIILWLGEEQFPNKEQDVPRKVLELQKFGLEIKWCEDTRSYKKLLPALQTYPNSAVVTADDDIWFWATALRNGTKIALAAKPLNSLIYINPDREANANDDGTLFAYNGTGGNDAQLKAVLAAYPELAQMLQDDYSSPAKVQ